MVCGLVLGPADAAPLRRATGTVLIVTLLAGVIVCFAFFWPLWTHDILPDREWSRRIWFDAWI
jgi:dolichyl-phosphate-mannose--protein O-mannosyl transferase